MITMTKVHGGIVLTLLTIVFVLPTDARMSAADIDEAGQQRMQDIEEVDRGNCCDASPWWVTAPNTTGMLPHRSSGLAESSCLELRDELGRTALHHATIQGARKAVRLLLAAGADVNARDNRGHTALDLASSYERWEIAEVLVDAGAEAQSIDRWVGRPSHATTRVRCPAAIRALVASRSVSNG
jgi:hypothetical protein